VGEMGRGGDGAGEGAWRTGSNDSCVAMQLGTACRVSVGMQRSPVLLLAPLLLLLACDGESGDGGGSSSSGMAGSSGDAETPGTTGGAGSTGAGSQGTTTGPDETAGGSTTAQETSSTGHAGDSSTGGEVPTSGPGVLPGETGLDAFCRRYVECGGTYYADQDECIDASVGYWGECAEVTEALDAFGACMSEIACDEYNPDTYNPASTPCSEQWGEVGDAGPC